MTEKKRLSDLGIGNEGKEPIRYFSQDRFKTSRQFGGVGVLTLAFAATSTVSTVSVLSMSVPQMNKLVSASAGVAMVMICAGLGYVCLKQAWESFKDARADSHEEDFDATVQTLIERGVAVNPEALGGNVPKLKH